MAYTKIKAIKKTLSKAIKYIENPAKTEGQQLVYGYGVEPLCAAAEFKMTVELAKQAKGDRFAVGGANNIAYHLIQSFAPEDNVTPAQALEIGKQLAANFTEGNFEYVVSTHIDKGQIHNHIIINATSFNTFKKLRTEPYKTASKIRAISDKLCADNQLSTIKSNERSMSSYKEYLATKNDTSWKANIRKRLSWLLQSCNNYEDFISDAAALGVTVNVDGKHIKYKMEGQERWVRGNKLDDMDTYTREGVKSALAINSKVQAVLKNNITAAVKSSHDYESYIAALAKSDISVRRHTDGSTLYVIGDEESVSETALGKEYEAANIITAIYSDTKIIKAAESGKRDVAELYKQSVIENPANKETRIVIDERSIKEITTEGALIDLPSGGAVFVDNKHINYSPQGNKRLSMEVFFNTKFNYYVSDRAGITTEQKGESIIRALSQQYGEPLHTLNVPADNIITLSDKGITIKLPGVARLFIEKEYVSYSKLNGGKVEVSLYDTYNYSYKVDDAGNKRATMQGSELRHLISNAKEPARTTDNSLSRRIGYAERKASINEVKGLSAALLMLRKENILERERYDERMAGLEKGRSDIESSRNTLNKTLEGYKNVAKCIKTYREYLPYATEVEKLPDKQKVSYSNLHRVEIAAFEKAKSLLAQMNVEVESVDEDKLLNLINEKGKELSQLDNDLAVLNAQKDKLADARQRLDSVQQISAEGLREHEQKQRSREEQIDNDGI